jgi:tetratricopeptide (TPR) repeat protein
MKKSIITGILLTLSLCSADPATAQDYIQQAVVYSSKGKYQDALLTLNKQISKNPTDQKAYMLLADIQMKLGKVDLAAATYGALESMGLVSDELFYAYGTALKMIGKYDEAISKFKLCSKELRSKADSQIESCQFAKELIKSDNGKKVMNMDINTESNEFGTSIFENTLVFNSDKAPFMTEQTANALSAYSGIYSCKSLMNGSAAAILMEGQSYQNNIEALSINENNAIVYSVSDLNANDIDTRMSSSKLYIGNFNGHSIENAELLSFEGDNSAMYSGTLSNDGNTIIFSSNREGGYGGFDLYKSTFENGKWNTPVNLGPNVNTVGNETTPHYNSGFLWFASNGHGGLGGYDLFSATELNNTFSNVNNLGNGINSSMNDAYPYVKNLVLYFSSEREGNGGYDIYRSSLSENQYAMDAIFNNEASIAINNSTSEEEVPQAIALNSLGNIKGYTSATEALSSARRVSLREVFKSDKPVVFFIQLASVATNTKSADKFKSLVKYGNIYKVYASNVAKIRLGYFLEKDETSRLLGKVKNAGFTDAFIVSQELDNDAMELLISQNDYTSSISTNNTGSSNSVSTMPKLSNKKETSQILDGTKLPNTKTNTPVVEETPAQTRVINSERKYKVRIGAFEDPIWFESNKVQDLGKIEQWTKGSWTIFILSGFDDFNNAEKARISAVNRGFTDSEVVIDNGGIIERIKKN